MKAKITFKNILDVAASIVLRRLGFGVFDNLRRLVSIEDGKDIESIPDMDVWLIPAELFDAIPDGYPLVDINGAEVAFDRKKCDNDQRFGLLAYGILRPAENNDVAPATECVVLKQISANGYTLPEGIYAIEAGIDLSLLPRHSYALTFK